MQERNYMMILKDYEAKQLENETVAQDLLNFKAKKTVQKKKKQNKLKNKEFFEKRVIQDIIQERNLDEKFGFSISKWADELK